MVLAVTLILLLYLLLIIWLWYGTYFIKTYHTEQSKPSTTFSIIIPFRDEAQYLPSLIDALESLDYPTPLFEIFFIDDASSDGSTHIIDQHISTSRLNIKQVPNKRSSSSPKKDAILTAIAYSTKEWILTTDADCIVPQTWLSIIDSFIQGNAPEMVVAPVMLTTKNTSISSFLYAFETLDFASLIGTTIGGFGVGKLFMANGANLAYRKEAFNQVDGFTGNDNIASGDDVFLLQKFTQEFPYRVRYLKNLEATVQTHPTKSLGELFQQRKRWAAKTSVYISSFAKMTGIIVFLGNLATLFGIGYFIWNMQEFAFAPASLAGKKAETSLLSLLFLKLIVDYALIYRTTCFLKVSHAMLWYPLIALLYPLWTIVVATASLITPYSWKGRTFSR